MPQAVLDEELAEGIKQAKKSPRNFALIAKGVTPVKLMVRKKKFREAELMKAKSEAKGNDIIMGVLQASGSDFAFLVVANAEPGVKTMKLKELISEQTEIVAKPRWELVKELPEVQDDEDETGEQGQQQTPVESAQNAEDLKKRLTDALKALAPSVQKAILAQPAQRDPLLAAVEQVKSHLAQSRWDEAQAALDTLTGLVNVAGQAPSTAPGGGKVSLVKLGKARLEWVSVRDAALADIRRLQAALQQEFSADTEQAQILTAAIAKLGERIQKLEVKLPEQLDQVLNADEADRPALIATARQTIGKLTDYLSTDPIMTELDGNEVLEDMRVVAPIRAKLGEISAALG